MSFICVVVLSNFVLVEQRSGLYALHLVWGLCIYCAHRDTEYLCIICSYLSLNYRFINWCRKRPSRCGCLGVIKQHFYS